MFSIKNQSLAPVMAALLVSGPSAFAITLFHSAAPSPGVAGNGLTGRYYGQVSISNLIFTTDCAMDYIKDNKPVATFDASQINYPGNGFNAASDGVTLGAFLGKDATTLSNKSVANNKLTGQLFDFEGYINVKTAGTYSFALGSDDGSRLLIGGKTVVDNALPQGFTTRDNDVTFKEAGLYSLEVAYFENWGDTGVRLSSDLSGGMAPVSSSLLYPAGRISPTDVPEPGSVALLIGVGTLSCSLVRRKRQVKG